MNPDIFHLCLVSWLGFMFDFKGRFRHQFWSKVIIFGFGLIFKEGRHKENPEKNVPQKMKMKHSKVPFYQFTFLDIKIILSKKHPK